MTVCFLDTETTGLDPDQHEIWEVALIVDDEEYLWQLPVDLGRADARALDVGRFHERRQKPASESSTAELALDGRDEFVVPAMSLGRWCHQFARLTWGRHLVGAVVSFDEERLRRLLRANHACPGWHYHLIDVEALAVGAVGERARLVQAHPECFGNIEITPLLDLPWDSRELSRAVGVDPDQFDKHTALGDARWAKAIYEACTGGQP